MHAIAEMNKACNWRMASTRIMRGLMHSHLFLLPGDYELLGSLLSQLRWLVSNVVYGDANVLLAHYKDYKCKVPQNVSVFSEGRRGRGGERRGVERRGGRGRRSDEGGKGVKCKIPQNVSVFSDGRGGGRGRRSEGGGSERFFRMLLYV